MKIKVIFLFLFFILFFASKITYANSIDDPEIILNPYGKNPLAALIKFETNQPAQITIIVHGKNGAQDIRHTFKGYYRKHSIPILGLYPDFNNKISLIVNFEYKKQIKKIVYIKTAKVIKKALIAVQKTKHEDRYYYLTDGFVIDEYGNIRFSFNSNDILYYFNNEVIQEERVGGLTRFSLIGEEKQHYNYPEGFTSFAHGLGQKPNGNFLVLGSFSNSELMIDNKNTQSHRDFIIEIDYKTGETINIIDLAKILNPGRAVIVPKNHTDYGLNDWCHINGVDYDPSDETILASCRYSGIFKIDEKNKTLKWIISPNKGFEVSGRNGNGPSISDKVLVAVNSKKEKYSNLVQIGVEKQKDFKWVTKNHNVKLYPNNIIAVYDNAGPINDKDVYTTDYSSGILYQIDENKKTVQQIWRQDIEEKSDSGSSILYYPEFGDVVIYSSYLADKNQNGILYGLLTRYDLKTHTPLFSAIIYKGGVSYIYRVDDFKFY